MADWEEIKRLASDFQKIQLSSSTQHLSERNCIEIITWLRTKKLIDLIFTIDGKEYLTPKQLLQDIRNELCVNEGRCSLIELSRATNVDISHINTQVNELLKGQKSLYLVLGQLIDTTYIEKIAEEINEKLIQNGQINVSDLTVHYDLPATFLQQQIFDKYLGKTIFAQQDKNDTHTYFTESFIDRSKAKIRGALIGVTRPIAITTVLNYLDINEKLFLSLFDQIAAFGSLTNRSGGTQYIPNIYVKSQNEWVNNFFKQNGYLEYESLTKIGIFDHKSFAKKQFANESTTFLDSILVSKRIVERLEADLDECIASKTYIDLQSILPSVFNDKDNKLILQSVLLPRKQQQVVVLDNFIISKAFIDTLADNCKSFIEEKAKAVVESGRYQKFQTELQFSASGSRTQRNDSVDEKVDKREERRKKAAGGKSGGGTQGRETKTKSTKKFPRGGNTNKQDDDEVVQSEKKQLEVITVNQIKDLIQNRLEDEGLDELGDSLAAYLLPTLNAKGLEIASELYASTVADRSANQRQTHNEIQNKLNTLIGDVRLFEKGIKLVPTDLQSQLEKYLLKTLCTDIVTELLNYIAIERNLNVQVLNFTNEQRVKFVNDLPPEFKTPLLPLVKSLNGQSVDEFMTGVEAGLFCCSMIVKKIDKKKDRLIVLNHRHSLLEQLNKCDDLALVLHLATLVIFETATQCMVHASGRHVALLLSFLKQYLTETQYNELISYHDFVTLMLSGGTETENAREKLKEKIALIKSIANEYKKPGTERS